MDWVKCVAIAAPEPASVVTATVAPPVGVDGVGVDATSTTVIAPKSGALVTSPQPQLRCSRLLVGSSECTCWGSETHRYRGG